MKNKLICLLLIWSIFLVSSSPSSVFAQTVSENVGKPSNQLQTKTSSPNILKNDVKTDWKKSTSMNVLDTPVDFDKISKENSQPLPKKQKMSGKRKAMWIAIAVGIAAAIFLAIKFYRECEIQDPDCDPFYEEYCQCLKYKEKT